jgi:hypothetical protein
MRLVARPDASYPSIYREAGRGSLGGEWGTLMGRRHAKALVSGRLNVDLACLHWIGLVAASIFPRLVHAASMPACAQGHPELMTTAPIQEIENQLPVGPNFLSSAAV